jgi:transposase
MSKAKPDSGKRKALQQQSVFNPNASNVSDPLFQSSEFFDPEDLVQVKYEMLRRVEADQQPVSQAAAAFGFSRPTFYQAQSDFKQRGLAGLIPDKPGPKRAHKLTGEVLDFVSDQRAEKTDVTATELARRIKKEYGVKVHPRSIDRALRRRQKKPR